MAQPVGVSLSPPFVLSLAISEIGMIAVGTADGRLWIGAGGEKGTKKKRSRKWEGMKKESSYEFKIAEGPVIGLYVQSLYPDAITALMDCFCSEFVEPTLLLTSTLLGCIAQHRLHRPGENGPTTQWRIQTEWTTNTERIKKANALAIHNDHFVVGGFDKMNKGVVEIWRIDQTDQITSISQTDTAVSISKQD